MDCHSCQNLGNTIVVGLDVTGSSTYPFTITPTTYLPFISYNLSPGTWELKYGIALKSSGGTFGHDFYTGGLLTSSGPGINTLIAKIL